MRAGLIDSDGTAARASRPFSAEDAAALHASLDPAAAALAAARVIRDLTAARSCGVWATDGDDVASVAAVDGSGEPVPGFAGRRGPRSPAVEEAAASRAPVPARVPEDSALAPDASATVVVAPLAARGTIVAVAALAEPQAVDGLEDVFGSAGAALANAFAFEHHAEELAAARRRAERLELLHDLGAALVDPGGTDALVERLNDLLRDRGVEVEAIAWKSRSLARRVGGCEPTPPERALLRTSRSTTPLPGGRVAVAVGSAGAAVGAMRVRGAAVSTMPFLELLAEVVAEVAGRMSARAEVEEAARGAALARERGRIAAGLHDTAGQLFVAIRMLARREAEQLPPVSEAAARLHRLADLADHGKWEIDHAIDALAPFPAARHGLVPALRSLGSSFHAEGDLDVIVDVHGRPARLPPLAERALYRVVHESLANARQTRCSVLRVSVTFDGDGVRLEVADDGTCLTGTIPDRGRPGTADMRRAVTDAGGSLRIRNSKPRGVVIEAAIPKATA